MDKEIQRIEWFIREYIKDANADGAVVGISGGLDSAVVATLAVRALGKDNVKLIFLPAASTPGEDYEDVGKLLASLGIAMLDAVNIDEMVSAFGVWKQPAKGNITARIRMTTLYAQANLYNNLVLGTSDKSELALGYFTKWGDGAADILPIAHLYKTQVRKLAWELGVPENIIKKQSSPALEQGKTAEDDLGFTYDEIDRMLKGELIMHSKVEALVARSWHKTMPIPRLS